MPNFERCARQLCGGVCDPNWLGKINTVVNSHRTQLLFFEMNNALYDAISEINTRLTR
jgi:hypothetical protein